MSQLQFDNPPFEVISYSLDSFVEIIAQKTSAHQDDLRQKPNISYFQNYFSCADISASTIVIENDYIDHDYLDDYVEYYAKCYKSYKRKCTRLHFFSKSFSSENFIAALKTREIQFINSIQESYLGFMVLKPLPKTVIGRTCLKTYTGDNGRRHYLSITSNEANLFGIKLKVESLPFQEQDSTVAACATSALWSGFKATGKLFQHYIPSPSQITTAATKDTPGESRYFPNAEGLTAAQMAAAIRSVGLEPLRLGATDLFIFKRTLYAYVMSGIPLMLIMQLVDTSDPNAFKVMGLHAVAVTGFSIDSESPDLQPLGDTLLKAYQVDKVYAHDDQIGPFSRLVVDNGPLVINGEPYFALTTTWRSVDGSFGKVKAIPSIFLVPLYNKIRIPFQSIFSTIRVLDSLMRELDRNTGDMFGDLLCWDIKLTTVNDLKSWLVTADVLGGDDLYDALIFSYPKYLWQSTLEFDGKRLCDILFDATDIDQGACICSIIMYDNYVSSLFSSLVELKNNLSYSAIAPIRAVLEYIERHLDFADPD